MAHETVFEVRDAIRSGKRSAEDVVRASLERIHADDKKIGAFLETFDKEAIKAAKQIDADKKAGKNLPPLAGVPIAVKDNILVKGRIASAASKILKEYKATYDATAVKRLRDAGAIIIGRTNCDEFAMGVSTEYSAYQKTHNPWNRKKIPGGSSGGSAAAVAAGFVPAALGSDTGGSVRQPASLCGIVGMKSTYGRVSRYGLIALASSFDQIGAFASTVEGAALLLQIIEGHDPKDGTSISLPSTTVAELLPKTLEGVKVGVPKEFFVEEIDDEVRSRVEEAIEILKEKGASIKEVSLPSAKYAVPAYYIILPAEASANLGRYDGIRYGTRAKSKDLFKSYVKARGKGFGPEVKRRIMLGTYILSAGYYDAYYKKAQAVRTAIFDEVNKVMKRVDVLAMPTMPGVAWDIGAHVDDPVTMYLADVCTSTANIVGAPAISVPCGFAHDLPVGLQIMGGRLEDEKVLQTASVYQSVTDWHVKHP